MNRRGFLGGFAAALVAINLDLGFAPPALPKPQEQFPLRFESLEPTLTRGVGFKVDHTTLWRDLPKVPAYNTIEEYAAIAQVHPAPRLFQPRLTLRRMLTGSAYKLRSFR